MASETCHVLVLPYPAQGHINPLLQFAKRLVSKGIKATVVTTPYTINSIDAPTVSLETISDGFDEGGFKEAGNVEAYLESFKRVGSSSLTHLINKFGSSGSPVSCIVYDSLLPWVLDVARKLGIYAAIFLTNSASVCSLYWQVVNGVLSLPVKEQSQSLLLPGLPPLAFDDFPTFLAYPTTHSAYLANILHKFQHLCQNDWIFCNSFKELEMQVVKALQGQWPLMMVGPMVPSAYLDQQIHGDTAYGASLWKPAGEKCRKWLDSKPPNSVMYISFGSMADVSTEQVEELAWGLQASNRPFLWVLRGSENKLPDEFLSSVGKTGLVVEWCNQLEVLAHPAVGCFVTHSGWNSTMEALSLGVPMVCVTQWCDQTTNAKFVEDVWKVGVRAKKDDKGILTRRELEMCTREVMVGEKSEEIRRNASKWRELAKEAVSVGGSSDLNVNEFVVKLLEGKKA